MLWNNKRPVPFIHLIRFNLVISLLISGYSYGKNDLFSETEVTTPYVLTHPIYPLNLLKNSGEELLTFGLDDEGEQWLLVFAQNEKNEYQEIYKTLLPQNFYRFDISSPKKDHLQSLYFLSSRHVFLLDHQLINSNAAFKNIHTISSVAMGSNKQYITKGNFLTQLTNDNFDDIYLADFNEAHLFIQTEQGFSKSSLPIKAESMFTPEEITYFQVSPYFEDVNFDGLPDVIYVKDGKLTYFIQQQDSSISPNAQHINLNQLITSLDWWNTLDENGEKPDQSQLLYRRVEQLKDINNDGIIDLVVRFTQSEGVLKKTNDYEIYLGRNTENQLSFLMEPDSLIKSEGTLTDIKFIDINNDNKDEIFVAGFDIGLSQIIGALLSGSIDQDVHLFYMDEQSHFNKKNKVTKEVKLEFSLSSGTSGSPVSTLLDVNGDGLKDLLLSHNDDTLKLFVASNNSKNLFAKRSLKHKTHLPKQGNMLITHDLNNDGKEDMVIKYGREDEKHLRNTFKILLAQ